MKSLQWFNGREDNINSLMGEKKNWKDVLLIIVTFNIKNQIKKIKMISLENYQQNSKRYWG